MSVFKEFHLAVFLFLVPVPVRFQTQYQPLVVARRISAYSPTKLAEFRYQRPVCLTEKSANVGGILGRLPSWNTRRFWAGRLAMSDLC